MHSIIQISIAVAAVLILAVPLNADRGDPSPTPPDSEVVEGNKCAGCVGDKLADILTPDDNSKHGIFKISSFGSTPPIKAGTCKAPKKADGKCGETEPGKGCTLVDAQTLIHMPRYKQHGDLNSLTWEVKYPQNGKKPAWSTGEKPLKRGEVVMLPGSAGNPKPVQWDCGTTLEVVIRWTNNTVPHSKTRRFHCTPCEDDN